MHRSRSYVLSLATGLALSLGVSPALAQQGSASLGVSHSSIYDTTANVGLTLSGLFETDTDFRVRARAGRSGQDGQIELTHRWQRASGDWRLTFSGGISDWDSAAYAAQGGRVELVRSDRIIGGATLEFGGFAQFDDITSVAVQASPILARDLGQSTAAGLSIFVRQDIGDFSDPVPTRNRSSYRLGGRLSGLGERKFTALEARAEVQQPLVSSFFFTAQVSAGRISGLSGQDVSVLDRAFLGDTAPRGFEYGGLGPRDVASGQALGGSSYYHGSLEIAAPVAQSPVILGGFVDFGSVWDVTGDASTAQSNGHALRSSAGVSAKWHGRFGALAIALAQPVQEEAGDRSETFSVTFNAEF